MIVANSWREQRDWGIFDALDALHDHPLADQLRPLLDEIRNIPAPDPWKQGYKRVPTLTESFSVGKVNLSFSSQPFSVDSLSVDGVQYASPSSSTMLGALLYQTFTADDFDVSTTVVY